MEETSPNLASFEALPRHALALTLVLLFAAAIRLYWNDVGRYSPADEAHYLRDTRTLVSGGIGSYPAIVDGFLGDPTRWVFPNPLRWGYLGLTSLFAGLSHDVSFRALATLSTIAGILSVLVTYLIGTRLFEPCIAIFGAALMATSPLQLAFGRRALADEMFCLFFLLGILLLLCHLQAEGSRARAVWLIGWIAAAMVTFAVKEQFLFVYPFVLLFWWFQSGRLLPKRLILIWSLPPVLYAAVFCLLSSSVTKFFRIASIITSEMGAPYAAQYQSGPPHRILIDFLAIAPLVTMSAIIAAGYLVFHRTRAVHGEWHLFVLLAGIVAVHALLPSKNLRYVIETDPLARLLVASLAWREIRVRGLGWLTIAASLVINGIAELALFVAVFVRGGVYDPVTDSVLRALEMLPR